jgi:hypothetical protein
MHSNIWAARGRQSRLLGAVEFEGYERTASVIDGSDGLDWADMSDPVQLHARARIIRANFRHNQSVVAAADALDGYAYGLTALYRIEDGAKRDEYFDEFLDVGVDILDLIAYAIKAVEALAVEANAALLVALTAATRRQRLVAPPEPWTSPPTRVARSKPALAEAPPSSRVALLRNVATTAAAA